MSYKKNFTELESENTHIQALLKKAAKLERLIAQEDGEFAFLEKGFELLSEEYRFDIKKNTNAESSSK